jgi:hypothetical protein
VSEGGELRFLGLGSENGEGGLGLGLKDGYLVGVGNETVGWSVCDGDMSERVLVWKGGVECEKVFLQAVGNKPY